MYNFITILNFIFYEMYEHTKVSKYVSVETVCHCTYSHAVISPRNVQMPPSDDGYPSFSTMENRGLSLSPYSLSLLVQDQLHTTTR